MDRKTELLNIVGDDKILIRLVDEVIFIETQLEYLKTLPQINVNPNNTMQQKATPAAKQYKEFLQQYTNIIKVLAHVSGDDNENDISPLRKWAAKYVNSE
jgi:hypothetical protein